MVSPARPFSFEDGWNGVATQNTVLATPYYIYSCCCLRLIGSDSGPTRRMGKVNGWLSMVCYHWGSRSPETACVGAPTSRLGGGVPGFWQYDRRREAAAGAAALVSRQWSPPPNVAEYNKNMTIRRIYNKTRVLKKNSISRLNFLIPSITWPNRRMAIQPRASFAEDPTR